MLVRFDQESHRFDWMSQMTGNYKINQVVPEPAYFSGPRRINFHPAREAAAPPCAWSQLRVQVHKL